MDKANIRAVNLNNKKEARELLRCVGADPGGLAAMSPKAVHRALVLERIPVKAAHILKQEMLSRGGDAAVNRGVVAGTVTETDVVLLGTLRQFELLIQKLKKQPFGLANLADEIQQVLSFLEHRPGNILKCGRHQLVLGERTLVMGIVNITPDSFSDGGRYIDPGYAEEHALRLVAEGADIIDLGAESTRPGFTQVDAREEWQRLQPVLERLAGKLPVPISVDTYKAETARKALDNGAEMINDIWGLKADPELAKVAAAFRVPLVVMHNQEGTEYRDLLGDIIRSLRESVALAEQAGVPGDQVIIDPGIGFGKTTAQNLEVMRRLREFASLGKPILLGTSRKSMIGNTLGLPVDQRLEGTAATVALGIAGGVDIARVHDVKEMVRVVKMTDAIVR